MSNDPGNADLDDADPRNDDVARRILDHRVVIDVPSRDPSAPPAQSRVATLMKTLDAALRVR